MEKALIIDDEIDICYLLGGILRNKNMQTTYANSLSEAAVALGTQAPSVIFIDNHLPDGKGTDFIKYIRHVHPHTKIVMITAHDNIDDRNKALKMGADRFIGKPFTSDSISRVIREIVN